MARERKRKKLIQEVGMAFRPLVRGMSKQSKAFVRKGEPTFAFAVIPLPPPVVRPKQIIKKQKRRRR